MTHTARRSWLLLLGLLALALLVRLFPLQREGLWLDEAYSLHLALQPAAQIISQTAVDNHPPLYYLLLHAWLAVFGAGVMSARFFSITVALLATAVAVGLARRLTPSPVHAVRTALFAGLLLAASPFWTYYSQEIRQYSLLGLCALVATWGVWSMHDEEGHPWAGATAFVLGSVAGLYTMYVGGLVVLALAVSGLLLCRRRRLLLFGSLAVIGLAFLPWLPVLQQQFTHLQQILAPSNSLAKLLVTPVVWVAGYTQTRQLAQFAVPGAKIFLAVGSLVTLGLMLSALLPLRRSEDRSAATLLLPPIVLPPLLLWLVSLHKPMYLTYVLLPSGLLFLVLTGLGLARLRLAPVWLGVCLAFFAVSLGLYWHSAWYGRGQTSKHLADYLQANTRPGDVLLFGDEWLYLPPRVYADLAHRPWPRPSYLLVPSHVAPASTMWPPVVDGNDPAALATMARRERAKRLILIQMRGCEVTRVPPGLPIVSIEGSSQNHYTEISTVDPPTLLWEGNPNVH